MSSEFNNSYMYYSAFDKQIRDILFKEKKVEKFLVISSIIFNTNFTESYKDLSKNESYFSYSYIEKAVNVGRSKLQNIMKELEEEGYIQWIYKSNTRYKESILRLNFKHGKGYGGSYYDEYDKKYYKEYDEELDIYGLENNNDTIEDMVKDSMENTVKDTYSKNISKNESKNISNYEDDDIFNRVVDIKVLEVSRAYLNLNNTSYNEQKLLQLQNEFSSELLVQAIVEAGKRNANSLEYVEKVLNDWRKNRINTPIEIKEYISKYKSRNSKNTKKGNIYSDYTSNNSKRLKFNNFKGRDYDYDELERKLLGWDRD